MCKNNRAAKISGVHFVRIIVREVIVVEGPSTVKI